MKRSLLISCCLFVLAPILSVGALMTGSSVDDPPDKDPALTASQDRTNVQEWDPERDGIGDLTEGPRFAIPPDKRKPLEIIGRRFSPDEFVRYVRTEVKKHSPWRPSFIVLHNTWKPTLAMRPNGFTVDNMSGLANFYGLKRGWNSGPHVFVDQNGIWVFTPLTSAGTHSPSWNGVSWGVEQLGDFETEDYDGGVGAKIRDNAVAAVAILSLSIGIDASTLRFHKDDHRTTHKCPGIRVKKEQFIPLVKNEMDRLRKTWKSK